MSRISDILVNARDILADQNAERWSDETLLRLVQLALQDIAKQTLLYRREQSVQLVKGKAIYELPTDLISLQNVLLGNTDLPIASVNYMDTKVSSNWRNEYSDTSISHAVKTEHDWDSIRVYPVPLSDSLYAEYTFDDGLYGIDVGIEGYIADSVYGIISSLFDSETVDLDYPLYGIIASASEGEYLTFVYNRTPELPTTVASELDLPLAFDNAIVQYVAGKALRHDLNVQNRQFGTEELSQYARELRVISDIAATDRLPATEFPVVYSGMGS
ncbi:hypothetical protein [Caudoviricetes sp.]|nr:hypothetical protein [Caudoviricetes sp.]